MRFQIIEYAIGHLICMHYCKYNAVLSMLYEGLVPFCMVFFLAGYRMSGLLNVFLSAVGRCQCDGQLLLI